MNKFDDFDIGPQCEDYYIIQEAWEDYMKTLKSQAHWVKYYKDGDIEQLASSQPSQC